MTQRLVKKPMMWSGVLLAIVGLATFALFVLPQIGAGTIAPTASDVAAPDPASSIVFLAIAVIVSGLALAGGWALIGIGLGRWRHPTPSPVDGSPEV